MLRDVPVFRPALGTHVTHLTSLRISANIRPMSQHRVTNCMDSIKYPYYVFDMLYCALIHDLNFKDRLLKRRRHRTISDAKVYILSDE